jgi:hypothetical protein
MMARILMTAEHTRTALPMVAKSQCPLPPLLPQLLPIPPPGVKGNQIASASAIGAIATNAAVKDFPLGFVLAYPYSGFIQ